MQEATKPESIYSADNANAWWDRLCKVANCQELILALTSRELTARYRQSVLGISWVLLQPLIATGIFVMVFSRYSESRPATSTPYPLLCLTGLLLWQLISGTVTRVTHSIVNNYQLVSKTWFPRLAIPIAAGGVGIVDFCFALLTLIGLLCFYGQSLTINVLFAPIFVVMAVFIAFGVGLWLAALNVEYRDVTHALPFALQCAMFLSPVVYPLSFVKNNYASILAYNPVSGIIEGFRWSLLGTAQPTPLMLAISAGTTLVIFLSGLIYFQKVETYFADRI